MRFAVEDRGMKIENRGYIFAILGPLSSILSALRLRSHGAFSGREGRFVVWMVAYFFYVFDVSDGVTAIDHEDCAALDAKFLNECSISLAEGIITMIGEGLNLVDTCSPAPPFLSKRQIHADRQNRHISQVGSFLNEASSLRIADRCVEGRHHADEPHLTGTVHQRNVFQVVRHYRETRGLLTCLEFRPHQREWIPLQSSSCGSFLRHFRVLLFCLSKADWIASDCNHFNSPLVTASCFFILRLQLLYHRSIGQGCRIAQRPPFGNVTQQSPHNLSAASLRQFRREEDGIRPGNRADLLRNVLLQF